MATITDDDLKMFQERAKTEFASRCDTGGIAWDSVIWDLCNEVRGLRSVSTERGDCAKLRKAVVLALSLLDLEEGVPSKTVSQKDIDFMKAALAAPPRNCDRFGGDNAKLQKVYYSECGKKYDPQDPISRQTYLVGYGNWLLSSAAEKKRGNYGRQ